MFNGLGMNLGNLSRLSNAETRSISPENVTGEKGKGAMSLDGLLSIKISPYIFIQPGETVTLAEIDGPGAIQQIWMTMRGVWRQNIIRFYWEDRGEPSVEVPVGDFFASGWGTFSQVSSIPVCVNPGSAFNCYWEMPFRRKCKITMTNISDERTTLFYQINYTLTEIPEDCAYFHASFRRVNPLPYGEVYTILDNVKGQGHYVGTYMAWGTNNNGWWGEGEIKFYIDGDSSFPTICGTGTEDYFCGSYDFENPETHDEYVRFTTPYSGLNQVIVPDKLYLSQFRFGMYRWHIMDPIRFKRDLKVTIQALGWRNGKRYLPLQDDIASVAYWYQTLPSEKLPPLPDRDYLEII